MRQYNIHEAKTHLSRLVDDAGDGETIIVAKAGKPVAALVPLAAVKVDTPVVDGEKPAVDDPRLLAHNIDHRRFGFMKGLITVPDDFDTMFQDEIIAMFEGEK